MIVENEKRSPPSRWKKNAPFVNSLINVAKKEGTSSPIRQRDFN